MHYRNTSYIESMTNWHLQNCHCFSAHYNSKQREVCSWRIFIYLVHEGSWVATTIPLYQRINILFICPPHQVFFLTSNIIISDSSDQKVHPMIFSDHAPVSFIWKLIKHKKTTPLDGALMHVVFGTWFGHYKGHRHMLDCFFPGQSRLSRFAFILCDTILFFILKKHFAFYEFLTLLHTPHRRKQTIHFSLYMCVGETLESVHPCNAMCKHEYGSYWTSCNLNYGQVLSKTNRTAVNSVFLQVMKYRI